MSNLVRVIGISGSLRQRSYNSALLRAAVELAPEGVVVEIADISDVPLYNGDLETNEQPAAVQAFRAQIKASDAVLFATPEYNYSFSGVLKNAIDWASRPSSEAIFSGKPVAIMGAGGRFGTVRAQLQLRQVLMHLNAMTLNRPEVMIPMAWEHFDNEGRLMNEQSRTQLQNLLIALRDWTRKLAPTQAS